MTLSQEDLELRYKAKQIYKSLYAALSRLVEPELFPTAHKHIVKAMEGLKEECPLLTCVVCKTRIPLESPWDSDDRKYCSDTCRTHAYREKKANASVIALVRPG